MASYYLSFESRARPGQEEAYARWYDEVHVPDVLAVPGFKRLVLRYRVVNEEPQPRWVSIFEVDGDPKAALGGLNVAGPKMVISDALDRDYVKIDILESQA